MDQLINKATIAQALDSIQAATGISSAQVGLVLGSGLGEVASFIADPVELDYSQVAHMVVSTAASHAGRFVFGHVGDTQIVCMQGRLHSYEGYSAQQVAFPIYVMRALGVEELIVTNAAGGIDSSYQVGDLMLIEDHINLLGVNPCIGSDVPDVHERFFDMTHAYAPQLRQKALAAARQCGIELRCGVYVATPGPSFETPAEIRAFRTMGADAVGMSTVIEVIAANSCGMKVLGISMISNPAAGVVDAPVDTDDVVRASKLAAFKLGQLLKAILSASE